MPENNMSGETETQGSTAQTQETVETTSEPTVRRSTRVSRPLECLDPSWT